jgi:hypothetical protein
MIFSGLCPPALIYLIYSVVQIGIDIIKGFYNTAFVKVWVAFIFTILLNYLCQSGLGIISWIIIFIPFVLMTVIVSVLLFSFGLNPDTGKLLVHSPNQGTKVVGGGEKDEKKKDDNSYGIDLSGVEQDVDQLLIQQSCESGKNKDRKYCTYTELVKNSDKRRRRYVNKARDELILIKSDKASQFMNQCESCISEKTDLGFEDCFLKKVNETAVTLSETNKKLFIDKLKEKQLIN